jgi:hypothetical protein
MPIKVSFFDMAHDQALGEADRRNAAAAFEKGRAWDAKHAESVRTSAHGAAVTIFDCSL